MRVDGKPYRTIWLEENGWSVRIIDQTKFPHVFETVALESLDDAVRAIRDMQVRGAPLIGATAAYGVCLALRSNPSDSGLAEADRALAQARPTAINLRWALDRVMAVLKPLSERQRLERAYGLAREICDEDVQINQAIGRHGLPLLEAIAKRKGRDGPVNVLTHCNAGWLATVDWGTATAPIYMGHDRGLPVHVWVDETRPRNQGSALTAWELGKHGVSHTVIADNVGGHLMQHGLVDLVIVGTDRTTAGGDVCNKIGTYLKALAADANGVPFYVAAPSPSIDFSVHDGFRDIPIEERAAEEVATITGRTAGGRIETVAIVAPGSPVANYAFDVTPARYVTGLITERGVIGANAGAIADAFPERSKAGVSRTAG